MELKKNEKGGGINIREGVMDNMVAVLDPALLDGNDREQRSIFQVLTVELGFKTVNIRTSLASRTKSSVSNFICS